MNDKLDERPRGNVKVKPGTCPFCEREDGILHPGDRCRWCGRLGDHRAMMGARRPWRR